MDIRFLVLEIANQHPEGLGHYKLVQKILLKNGYQPNLSRTIFQTVLDLVQDGYLKKDQETRQITFITRMARVTAHSQVPLIR